MTQASYRRTLQIPLSPTEWASLDAPFPLSPLQWEKLGKYLEAMRPDLVAERTYDGPARPPLMGTDAIVKAVAHRYGIDLVLLRDGRTRVTSHTEARWVAMALLRWRGLSLPQIGRVMHRDHTTVLYALRKIKHRPDLQRDAEALSTTLSTDDSASAEGFVPMGHRI